MRFSAGFDGSVGPEETSHILDLLGTQAYLLTFCAQIKEALEDMSIPGKFHSVALSRAEYGPLYHVGLVELMGLRIAWTD